MIDYNKFKDIVTELIKTNQELEDLNQKYGIDISWAFDAGTNAFTSMIEYHYGIFSADMVSEFIINNRTDTKRLYEIIQEAQNYGNCQLLP